MSTISDRPSSALLIVDVQNGVVAEAYGREGVIANINTLVEKARREAIPVIWVQHSDEQLIHGSAAWQVVPELAPLSTEPRIAKNYGDAFEGTDLEAVLSALSVGKLFVVGAETDACIRSTIHGAFTRGYDTILISDAHTTGDRTAWGAPPPDQVIAHTNLYWKYQSAPGRKAGVVTAAQADFVTA